MDPGHWAAIGREYKCFLQNEPCAQERNDLDRFRPHGVHFSIDQFGINSTAFGFLQGLKLEQLKIDGSYISKLLQDRDNQFFLRSLTDIAHNLEIKIVTNFVENEAELKSVLALGMDGAQGYHIGKPELQG
jgi:EAL domain-containing protein (putative c-di-GMP-specific phosphodiesterase class I)